MMGEPIKIKFGNKTLMGIEPAPYSFLGVGAFTNYSTWL